ncbi:YebC/PmpR family DNA-binding transcriptional regulator [Candidatus Falkowbacteria bacterium]|uniref:Probable transcriptional regulatory protein COT80_00215 n=1 Tax=Candidatus Buchananbacteria bacterium CG10_big_fil_rev_8_21_14_0_10_33_19 TaxID=1974525 RepID=A0A2H0W5B4_9BACT|nr:YebC/PmpR family DNA-binding transcriptional regulator [Candidatus Falkowbacteria bacterium]PIS06533.1 MAG: YebC/PmpR family DNA-binding transcriptional regulator [Candidatus Buchananbacteria bacterium CG10_big_fil_rev_8_21_14_0_10_33_19]
MSGHSKWAKVHRQKSVADSKKGAVFTKLGNLITIAAKEGGGDTENNFKLRLAVEKARAANMPKDNIERAIKRGAGTGDGKNVLEEITYEVFGPNNSLFIIETITDNKNRTVSDLKTVLSKNNGQLGGPNSVIWQFERKGIILIDNSQIFNINTEDLELNLIDAGAEDIKKSDDGLEIITASDKLQEVEKNIKKLNIEINESLLGFKPKDELNIIDQDAQDKIEKLYNTIDDLDDVNNIYTNANW